MGRGCRAAAIMGLALAGSVACGGGRDGPATACAQIAWTGNRTVTDGLADVSALRDEGDGGEPRLLIGDWVATDPSLSPDGRQVVVVRADGDYESAGPGATSYYFASTEQEQWRLTYGVIEGGTVVPDRPVGPAAAPLYPQYGLDVGACPGAG